MTRQKQLSSLGIAADAYQGLVVVEIEGPPVVALSPVEARRFHRSFREAYGLALHDQDALGRPPVRVRVRQVRDEMAPDGSYGGARAAA